MPPIPYGASRPETNLFGGWRPGKKKPRPKRKRRGVLSIEEWAAQQSDKWYSQMAESLDAQRQIYLDELARQRDLQMQQGAALAEAMRAMNFPGAIQGVYQNAAGSQAGLAQGFSGALQDTAAADAAAQANMLSGTGQEGAVRNQGENMGNVIYGVGGYIPGKSLGETGAAFAADAALQPGFAQRQALEDAMAFYNEGLGDLSDFAMKKAELEGGRYELEQSLIQGRREEQAAAAEQRFEMLKWQADQHYRNYMLALERGDRKLAMREYKLAVRKQRQAEREAQRAHELDLRQQDLDEREQDWRESPDNPDNQKKPGRKVTPTQARDSMKDVVAATDDVTQEVAMAIKKGEWVPSTGRSKQRKALVNRLFKQYAYLALTPAARKRLKQIIMKAVTDAGRLGPQRPGTSGGSGGSVVDDILGAP